MATSVEIVDELMTEFGRRSDKLRMELEQYVGDVTKDLLSKGEGRFAELKKPVIITLDTTNLTYKLPADYNVISKTAYEIDDNGNPTGVKIEITSEEGAMQRRYAGEYAGRRIFHVEMLDGGRSGRGWYLVLGDEATEATRYKLFYYRKATERDTDLIRVEEHVKVGVRYRYYAARPEFQSQAIAAQTEYARRRAGFREDPQRHKSRISVRINPRAQEVCEQEWDIGEGN